MKARKFAALMALVAIAALTVSMDAAAAGKRVAGEPVQRTASKAPLVWRSSNYPEAFIARLAHREISLQRIVELQNYNKRQGMKRTQIGINRTTASDGVQKTLPVLRWQQLKTGGAVARIEVRSPDALALRVGLQLNSLDPRAELRFAGSDDPARVEALVAASAARSLANSNRVFWTPSTDGEIQIIEIYAPSGVVTRSILLQVPELSHLVTNSRNDFIITKGIGDSGSCNVDVICLVPSFGQIYVNAKNAVARMQFVDGGTFTCTGTLLADTVTATQIPYFYTADHCIGNQTVASTLSTFWGFEATACGSGVAAGNTQVTGGATYLYSSTTTDAALLRLNSNPPAAAFFAGWDNAIVVGSSAVTAIHHPAGDLKKVSLGQQVSNTSTSIEVGWLSGTTEGGSSGSGLFTSDANGYYLRGGLEGGSASCANDGNINNAGNRDYYSRLDLAYPNISQHLDPAPTGPGPTRDYTGAWYVPSESGWGLTLYGYDNAEQVLLGLWFVYSGSGQAKWYQIAGDWTANDVHSGPVRVNTGPVWSTSFNPAQVAFTEVGSYTLTFTSATSATLSYTVDGVTRNNLVLTKITVN